jgi:hypothetical protein
MLTTFSNQLLARILVKVGVMPKKKVLKVTSVKKVSKKSVKRKKAVGSGSHSSKVTKPHFSREDIEARAKSIAFNLMYYHRLLSESQFKLLYRRVRETVEQETNRDWT